MYQCNSITLGRGSQSITKETEAEGKSRTKLRGWGGMVPGNAETYPVLEVEVVELSPSSSELGEAAVAFVSVA